MEKDKEKRNTIGVKGDLFSELVKFKEWMEIKKWEPFLEFLITNNLKYNEYSKKMENDRLKEEYFKTDMSISFNEFKERRLKDGM